MGAASARASVYGRALRERNRPLCGVGEGVFMYSRVVPSAKQPLTPSGLQGLVLAPQASARKNSNCPSRPGQGAMCYSCACSDTARLR